MDKYMLTNILSSLCGGSRTDAEALTENYTDTYTATSTAYKWEQTEARRKEYSALIPTINGNRY